MSLYNNEIEQSLSYIARTIERLREGSHPNPARAAHLISFHSGVLIRAAERGEMGPFA